MKKTVRLLTALAIGTTFTFGVALAKNDAKIVNLGGALYKDLNLSLNQNQSCKTCHHPSAGFQDPDNRLMPTELPVSDGSDPTLFGGRNAPTAAYASSSPIFHFDPNEELFFGGMFWDGRATGWTLGDPLAEQALGPFLNPVEMALISKEEAVGIVQLSDYAEKFENIFGPDAFADVEEAYNNIGRAIAAFEKSDNLIQYKSKFDRFWEEQNGDVSTFGIDGNGNHVGPPAGFKSMAFTLEEAQGLALFNAENKGNCAACHLTTNDGAKAPVFTDFSYDNIGIPVNPQIAKLAGPQKTDFGLGAMITQLKTACDDSDADCATYFKSACDQLSDETDRKNCKKFPGVISLPDGEGSLTTTPVYVSEAGKFKVPTLRNVGRSAPYGHNGFFATLEEVTHFYNTRDVNTDWPAPEVALNVNAAELGDLGLTTAEEAAIVAFMKTLTD